MAQDASYGDSTQLIYLRARYYNPSNGRFQSRDMWSGNFSSPLSLNRWNYVEGNPVNRVDPSGYRPCEDIDDPDCISDKAMRLKQMGYSIEYAVRNGYLLPVEGLAQLTDFALPLYDYNIENAMWALTIIIDGFDASRDEKIWYQGWKGINNEKYWLGYNWLAYQNNPSYNVYNWEGTGETWVHSRRGDWRKEYWDKTANQAYHFWFPVAVTFYDNVGWAHIANIVHDSPFYWVDVDVLKDKEAPPYSGYTKQDWNLSLAGMRLGQKIYSDYRFIEKVLGYCPSNEMVYTIYYSHSTRIGSWIRANLK